LILSNDKISMQIIKGCVDGLSTLNINNHLCLTNTLRLKPA
jgi:hypothetical protein